MNGMSRLGFDSARLRFGLYTATVAWVAVLAAWFLGLQHPQWAAMTVWAVAQPLRMHLLGRGVYRPAGTVVGSVVGVMLVVLAGDNTTVLVVGLVLWSALCAGIGNLQRGFASYGTILAGYSAAMVALLGLGQFHSVAALSYDRMMTVGVGVMAAAVMVWWAARSLAGINPARLRAVARQVRRHVAAGHSAAATTQSRQALLVDIAALENELDQLGVLLTFRRGEVQRLRQWLLRQVSMLLSNAHEATPVARAVQPTRYWGAASTRHVDWSGARGAALRATIALGVVGSLWLFTGWDVLAYMMLGTAVMATVFSTVENPMKIMPAVIAGQVLGVALALVCRWWLWPLAGEPWQLVLSMLPFMLVGGLLYGHRRFKTASYDANMVMLLMLQPAFPLVGTPSHSLSISSAVLAAPVWAYCVYWVVPVNTQSRVQALLSAMVNDLQTLAARSRGARRHTAWRVRHYGRVLRLATLAPAGGGSGLNVVEAGVALAELESLIVDTRKVLANGNLSPAVQRRLQQGLVSLQAINRRPQHALRILGRVTARLQFEAPHLAASYQRVGQLLARNAQLFNGFDAGLRPPRPEYAGT